MDFQHLGNVGSTNQVPNQVPADSPIRCQPIREPGVTATPSEGPHQGPIRSPRLCLRCHERQRRRKAARRKARCRVTSSEFLGGVSIGRDKPAIGVVKLTPIRCQPIRAGWPTFMD